MFCKKCGTLLPEGSLFCPACGEKVEPETSEQTQQPAYDAPQPNPDTQQPVYNAPQPGYYEPQDSTAYGYAPQYAPQQEAPAGKPKKRKKRVLIAVLITVLALALIGGGIAAALVYSSPEYKASKALENTVEELDRFLNNAEDFGKMLDNLKELEGDFSCRVACTRQETYSDYYDETYTEEMSAAIEFAYSQSKEKLKCDYDVSFFDSYYNDNIERLHLAIYGDNKGLTLSLPDRLDDAYFIPTKNLGKQLVDSPLFDELASELGISAKDVEDLSIDLFRDREDWLEEFKKEYKEDIDAFNDSIEIEKSDSRIPDAPKNLTVYDLRFDWEAGVDLYIDAMDYYLEKCKVIRGNSYYGSSTEWKRQIRNRLKDIDLEIRFGINSEDCLSAIELSADGETALLLLDGDENLWEDGSVIVNGETVFEIHMDTIRNGFEILLSDGYDNILITCDDRSHVLSIQVEDELFEISYDCQRDGAQLSMEYDEDRGYSSSNLLIELSLEPAGKIESAPKAIPLLDLNKREIEDLMYELSAAFD